jgi:hypothetical protein
MEFVGDDSQIYSSQILDNIRELLKSSSGFTPETRSLRRDILRGVAVGSQHSEEVQDAFGKEELFQFLQRHLQMDSNESDSMTEEEEWQIVEDALWAWIRVCRREILQKPSANMKNCEVAEPFIPVIVDTMTRYIEKHQIVYCCSALIMLLASDSPARQQALGVAAAPQTVIQALKVHLRHPTALEMSLRAVRNLAADDEVANQLIQEAVGEELHAILQDYKQQPYEVIEAAVFAVINLSYDNNVALILGALGVCVSLTDLLPDHIENNDFCHHFCWALRNLSTVPQNLAILKFTNVCELLMTILSKHADDSETMQSAMWCIANLGCNNTLAHHLLSISVVEAMVNLYYHGVKHYPDDVKLGPISEAATFAIYNMTTTIAPDPITPKHSVDEADYRPPAELNEDDLEIKERLGNTGACWLLCEYLNRYLVREAMVEAVCRAINHLSTRCPSNQILFTQFHTIKALHHAMQHHMKEVDTLYLIWRSIFILTRRDTVDDSPFANHNYLLHVDELRQEPQIAQEIVEAMRTHSTFEEVLTMGIEFLVRLGLYSEEKIQELLASGHLKYNEYNDFTVVIKESFDEMSNVFEFERIASM